MLEQEVAKTIKIIRTKEGWVVDPEEKNWYGSSSYKPNGKLDAFIKGEGWKPRTILEKREVPALQRGYTLDELNRFVIRYGHQVTEAVLDRVFPGAGICQGSEISTARSLRRPAEKELRRFEEIFGVRWRDYLVYMVKVFGTCLFDLVDFDKWLIETQGYVEDGKTSTGDFIRKKWGDEVHDWFVDVIMNDELKEQHAQA